MKIIQLSQSYLDQASELFNSYRIFYGKKSDLSAAKKFLKERLENEESVVFLCVENDVACGFAQLYPGFSSVSLARIFVLNDLYVDENHRKKGVAKMLLDEAKNYAKQHNAVRLTLSTAKANKTAQGLYEANGYVVEEEYLNYNFTI